MHNPIENCYWVVPGKFLAGEYPRDMDEESSRVKINALIHSGITVFIDLTDKNDNLLPYAYLLETALHQRFPIRDVSIPDSTDITAAILDTIDHHIGKGGSLLGLAVGDALGTTHGARAAISIDILPRSTLWPPQLMSLGYLDQAPAFNKISA